MLNCPQNPTAYGEDVLDFQGVYLQFPVAMDQGSIPDLAAFTGMAGVNPFTAIYLDWINSTTLYMETDAAAAVSGTVDYSPSGDPLVCAAGAYEYCPFADIPFVTV